MILANLPFSFHVKQLTHPAWPLHKHIIQIVTVKQSNTV